MKRHAFRLSALLGLLLIGTSLAATRSEQETGLYRQLVGAYRDREAGVVQRISARGQDAVSSAIGSVLSTTPEDGWSAIDLSAASLLHSDAAFSLLKDKKHSEAQFHLNAAVRLMDAVVARSPDHASFVRRWRVVVAGRRGLVRSR